MSNKPDSPLSSVGPSPRLAKLLAEATPEQCAQAAKVAAKLLSRRAKRETSGMPIDLTQSSRATSASATVWLPGGLPEVVQMALSVPSSSATMDRSLFLSALESKLDALVRENPREARLALEMSQEVAPEFWEIAQSYQSKDWAAQIVHTDVMSHNLTCLSSKGQLTDPPDPPLTLREILELLD
jgi:hypothetical protein